MEPIEVVRLAMVIVAGICFCWWAWLDHVRAMKRLETEGTKGGRSNRTATN